MEQNNKRGGIRKNAGRKPTSDPKQTVCFYINRSCVLKFGSEQKLKEKGYEFFADYGLTSEIDFKPTTKESYDGSRIENIVHDEPLNFFKPVQRKPTMVLNRSVEQWIVLKRECEIADEWLKLKEQIDVATNLSDKQKQLIFTS